MKKIYTIMLVAIILLVGPVLTYVVFFHSQNISEKTSDWGALGDFLNPFISMINLLALGYFSYRVMKLEENRDKANRPILQCDLMRIEQMILTDRLIIKNIGASVALDIVTNAYFKGKNHSVRQGDLGINQESKFLIGPNNFEYCEITYKNALGENFSTIYRNPIISIDTIPQLTEEELNILFEEDSLWVKFKKWWKK